MLDESYLVEKSKPLVWAQFQNYGVGELKILDTYLSRINARDPESAVVTFTKREYAELMGLDPDMRTSQLKAYTQGLLSNVVTIDLPNHGYVQYPLFSEARCYMDCGQIMVKIECNEKLRPAFFGLAESGYIKYQLQNILALTSQYSVRLYPKLKDRPYGWTVDLPELRKILGATAKSYDIFKDFNKHVLQKAVREISEITDLLVTVTQIKKGRSVVAVKFGVKQKNVPQSPADGPEQFPEERQDDPVYMIMSVLPAGFTKEQADLLYGLAADRVPDGLGLSDSCLWISDYVQNKVRLMMAQRKSVAVNARFSWLRKAINEDWT